MTTLVRILLLPFEAAFFLLTLPIAAGVFVYERAWLARFLRDHHGTTFLICTRRHDWQGLLSNNVVPVLGDSVQAVWFPAPRADRLAWQVRKATRIVGVLLARPFLLIVAGRRLHAMPLNAALQALKSDAAKDAHTQTEVARVLAAACQKEQPGR